MNRLLSPRIYIGAVIAAGAGLLLCLLPRLSPALDADGDRTPQPRGGERSTGYGVNEVDRGSGQLTVWCRRMNGVKDQDLRPSISSRIDRQLQAARCRPLHD
jgi:hypothetical protein